MKGKFLIELSDFSFVSGHSGKMLRLTFSWKFEDSDTGAILGIATEGCLLSRDSKGKLNFQLPMVGWTKNGGKKQVHQLSKDLHKLVLDLIAPTRFVKHIGKDVPAELLSYDATDFDPSLPRELTTEINIGEGNGTSISDSI